MPTELPMIFAEDLVAAETRLPQIVVTARQSKSDADLGGTLERFTQEQLQQPGLFAASDLSQLSAGLTVKSIFGSSAPQFFIRGIGTNDVNPSANPGVAIYLNDVLIASPLGQNLALFDLAQADVLKGPQGTLFGRSATGGAVVFRTARPGEMRGGSLVAGAGSFGLQNFEAALDSGHIGSVTARIAGFSRRSDGYTEDTASGDSLNGLETYGARATVLAELPGRWHAEVIADYALDRSTMTAHEGLGLLAPEALAASPQSFVPCADERAARKECVNVLGYRYSADPFSEAFDRPGREYLDVGGVSINLSRSGSISVQSITSYREAAREVLEDTDASPLSLVALDFNNDSEALTQEFLLAGGGRRLGWTAGLFFLDETLGTQNRFDTLGTLRAAGAAFIDDPALFAFGPFRLAQSYTLETRSGAVFGEVDWAATRALNLTAGLRLTEERAEFKTETRFDETTAAPILAPERRGARTEQAASWRLAARFVFAPQRTLNASISRGFKSGSFNGGALFASDSIGPVAPEFVTAYEIGAKWRLTDRVDMDASAFRYDYTDLQDFTLRGSPPPTRQVLDSADAEMSGIDVGARARLPVGFVGAASLSYLDATFVGFVDANGVDRSGNRLTAAPELSAVASLQWDAQLAPDWSAGADLSLKYRSEVFFDNTNDALLKSDDATTVNLAVDFSHRPSRTTASIAVRNLTDNRVIADALRIAEYGFIQRTYAPPRAVFIELRKQF